LPFTGEGGAEGDGRGRPLAPHPQPARSPRAAWWVGPPRAPRPQSRPSPVYGGRWRRRRRKGAAACTAPTAGALPTRSVVGGAAACTAPAVTSFSRLRGKVAPKATEGGGRLHRTHSRRAPHAQRGGWGRRVHRT